MYPSPLKICISFGCEASMGTLFHIASILLLHNLYPSIFPPLSLHKYSYCDTFKFVFIFQHLR